MVVWRSRPRHPPGKEKLGSFVSRSCNDGKIYKMRDARAKSLFCQSNPIAFLPVLLLSLYMHVWIHGHHENKKPLNFKPILPVTMLL